MNRLESNPDFYKSLYPVLAIDGWEEVGQGYGVVNWQLSLPKSSSDLESRLYIVIHSYCGDASVFIDVYHQIYGFSYARLGDARGMSPADVLQAGQDVYAELVEETLSQYKDWLLNLKAKLLTQKESEV